MQTQKPENKNQGLSIALKSQPSLSLTNFVNKSLQLEVHEQTALDKFSATQQSIILAGKDKKFKEYSNNDKVKLNRHIMGVMMMLQIKNIPDPNSERDSIYYTLTNHFLMREFPNLTLPEFMDAMHFGIKNVESEEQRHFHSFGVDIISKYINNYAEYIKDLKYKFRLEAMKIKDDADRKPPSEDEKYIIYVEYCISIMKHFINYGTIGEFSDGFYDYVKNHSELKKMLRTIKREEAISNARALLEKENKNRMVSGKISTSTKNILKQEIKKINDKSDVSIEKYVTSRAMRFCCETVLKQADTAKLLDELQTILKNHKTKCSTPTNGK